MRIGSRIARMALGMLLVGILTGCTLGMRPPLRALILSGQNNHDWRATTPALKALLEADGRFHADVSQAPATLTADVIKPYDLIVDNWTNFPDKTRVLGPVAEKAIFEFVRSGKGFVLFHGAAATFPDWPDWHALIGACWAPGHSGHGARHTFKVEIADHQHPVTRGMRDFYLNDELWHRLALADGVSVLATAYSSPDQGGTGKNEPMIVCQPYGKGRVFFLAPGHDAWAMRSPAWTTLMRRGAQWAATGKVTVPIAPDWPDTPEKAELAGVDPAEAVAAVANFKLGDKRDGLLRLDRQLQIAAPVWRMGAAEAMAARLGDSGTSLDARKYYCQQLGLFATASQVPALAAALADPDLWDEALGALERLPGSKATQTLLMRLDSAAGGEKIGIVNALGERGDPATAPALAAQLKSADAELAAAAADALGRIKGKAALRALVRAEDSTPEAARNHLNEALLRHARNLAASGDEKKAAAICASMLEKSRSAAMRQAAFALLLDVRPDDASKRVLEALNDDDAALNKVASDYVGDHPDVPATIEVAAKLESLPARAQVQVAAALARRGDTAALPELLKLAQTGQGDARLAALAAVGRLGDSAVVAPLVSLAGSADDMAREAVRGALTVLRGSGVDQSMITQLPTAGPEAQRALIQALADRQAKIAVPVLMKLAGTREDEIGREAIKALGALADGSAADDLIALLRRGGDHRKELELALAAALRRGGDSERVVAAALDHADTELQVSLLRVAGLQGGPRMLEIVRSRLSATDPQVRTAAVRVLGEWPDGAPVGVLLAIAKASDDARLKVLALRGFAVQLGKAKNLEAAQRALMIREAWAFAPAEEKKALLGLLAKIPSPEALRLALDCLDQTDMAQEAGLAALLIAEKLAKSDPQAAQAAARRVASQAACGEAIQARARAAIKVETLESGAGKR